MVPRYEANELLCQALGDDRGLLCPNFHTLSAREVERLVEQAKARRYRKPKNANGSTGRYWYAYLQRRAAVARTAYLYAQALKGEVPSCD